MAGDLLQRPLRPQLDAVPHLAPARFLEGKSISRSSARQARLRYGRSCHRNYTVTFGQDVVQNKNQ